MSKSKGSYLIQMVAEVQFDFNNLPVELQKKWPQYQAILSLDPDDTLGFPSHGLIGKLRGCRALEIYDNQIAYRLVYRIYKKPSPKRVVILSFAEHDDAYSYAQQRKS